MQAKKRECDFQVGACFHRSKFSLRTVCLAEVMRCAPHVVDWYRGYGATTPCAPRP
jgi:hypothetical protein